MRIKKITVKKIVSTVITGGLFSALLLPTPAQAVPDGTVACSISGTFTVLANKVTGNTACTGRAVIPSGITEISNNAFLSATGVTSAFVPNTVIHIGTQAFQQSNLTTIDFEANSTLTSIASAAFQNIPLTSIVLPDSVVSLGNYQFWVNTSLTSVVLPANLSLLQEYTFGQATALNSITLPIGLASIEANTFAVNTALTSYTYCGLTISSAALNTGGLTGKTRNCTAAAIALSSTSEIVAPNAQLTGYTITSPNNFGGGVVNYSISPSISNTPGLSFETTTGRITGTPTTLATAQTYTISANNFASPSGTATFTITVGTPPPPPPPPPIPDPIQLSTVTGLSPESAAPGNATPVVISGKFVEKITNISINGNNLPAGSWSQSSTSISLTIPKGDAGNYEITLYNGSAPLLKVPTFTYTSPSNLTWSLQKAANTNAWNSVTFGEGKFVAVGTASNGDGAMYSTDGKNWIASSGVPNNDWQSVAYGNGKFVAVSKTGTRNRIITSDDGINWRVSTISQDFPWGWVKFGNGHFVVVARTEGWPRVRQPVLFHSVDGLLWTRSTITYVSNLKSVDQAITSLSFGNGVFTLTAANGRSALGYVPLILNSFNGTSWSHKRDFPGVSSGVTSIAYGCERYVGMGKSGIVDITADPQDWNPYNKTALIPAISFRGNIVGLNEVIYTSGLFLSVGNGTSGLSNNAQSWKEQILPSRNNWVSATFGEGIFVAVANSGSDNRVMTAPYAPLSLSRSSETVALGDVIQGFTPNFRGCPTATYSISPAITGSGLTFNTSTGQLTGTPTAIVSAKEYTVTLLDGSEYPATATYTLTVSAAKAPAPSNPGGSSAPSEPTSTPSSNTGTSLTEKPSETGTVQTPVTQLPTPDTSTPVIAAPKPAETTTVTAPAVVKGGPLESTLTLNVYFDMGSSRVYGSNLNKLQDLATTLSGLGRQITISITGYAQPTPGSEATDGKLSADRAEAVARILRQFGVTTKVVYKGAGRAILNVPSSRYVEIVAANSEG